VIVAHNGTRWLPQLFRSLEASTRFPDRLVAVDTGSIDETPQLLVDVLGESAVHTLDRSIGFGTAVQQALDLTDGSEPDEDGWLWLLHDDCSPAPDALERLLDVGESDPGISVVGGRIRAWPRARRMLEVGVTITGTGHRETGVEIGETDQGQHDTQRDVLSVSSAGMLVRRSTWNRLKGFDKRLPLFRDDLDFGWRVARAGGRVVMAPKALVFHAEAAARGVRSLDDLDHVPHSPHRADRQAALFTLLANCRLLALPFQYVRLAFGSVLRALAYLVGKLPSAAADELLAMVSVLGRPDRILGARARRRSTTTASPREVRRLLPSWWTPYANALDSLLTRFAGTVRDTAAQVASAARRRRSPAAGVEAVETGPVPDEAVNLPGGGSPVAWMVGHPITMLATVLTVVAAIATRGFWGDGWLQGGGLLPAPAGAAHWWETYTSAWHHVGMGSREAPSPYIAVMGLLSTVLLGKSWLALQLIVVLAVPLSAVGAYVAARRLVDSLAARVWMSVTYALLPAVTGVVTSGHIGTTVAIVALPWLVRSAVAMGSPAGANAWRAVFAAGLVLSVMVAFAPISWPMAVVAAIGALVWLAVTGRRSPSVLLRPVVAVVLPVLLLMPWSGRLLTSPSMFLTEAGQVDAATVSVADHAWLLPWGRIDAAGDAPWWLSIGLVFVALLALTRADRRPAIAVAWGVIGLGLVTTALLAGQVVTIPGTDEQAYVWVGLPVVLSQAAAVAAAGIAADGLSRAIQSGSFGWRQPLAALGVVLAIAGSLLGVLWWVVSAPQGSLTRGPSVPLPAYMAAAMQSESQQRILVISSDPDRGYDTYTVYADDGNRLGDDSVTPAVSSGLTDLVTDLVSEATPHDVTRLADYGIGFVVMPAPFDTDQVAQLDGLPGLTRASTNPRQLPGWQLDVPAGLVRAVDSGAEPEKAAASAKVLPAESTGHVDTDLEGGSERIVRVATDAPDGFSAQLDGTELASVKVDEGAGFATNSSEGGSLTVDPGGHRTLWLALQLLAVLVVIVLAAPTIQRSGPGIDEEELS
jgi:GT2 family glycosyltransferase